MAPVTNRTLTVLAVAGIGVLAYAVYFDHRRRTDARFRKQLRMSGKEKLDKSVAQAATSTPGSSTAPGDANLPAAEILAAMKSVKDDQVPTTPEEREKYFMSQVEKGEELCAKGPDFAVEAALAFFRALRVYPSPVELIMIFQNTVPEPVFKVKGRVEGYYEDFPPKRMSVSTKAVEVTDASGITVLKRILVANKDFTAGDVIYREQPIVTVLDPDLEEKGSHCAWCLRQINDGTALRPDGDRLKSLKAESQSLLFGPEYAIPIELSPNQDPETVKRREDAQIAFAPLSKNPLLPKGHPSLPTQTDEWTRNGYSLFDHMERVRFLELSGKENEAEQLREILKANLQGLEDFVTDERYTVLLGKMAYNAYGISFSGGRDDKPPPNARPEDVELTRTPNGTARQVGAGFFAVSSYISHSCDPCARPSFEGGDSEMNLVAMRDIKAGDEITVSYVDASIHDGEDVIQARYRRRKELARGWRFACQCDRVSEKPLHPPQELKSRS
ncbi:hypothetical protein B0F90DRAFT_1807816 [Multifurca ochricompacta]|uniref:SET domain-containing protein n=1 Tax=Multifurca ochricompacta TaxID=376703 RepID=A0AAD4QPQ7_9AGAM|nr:hypothetical protein B0F90DRAFT_1807816 [Multifurca ochricompacta]